MTISRYSIRTILGSTILAFAAHGVHAADAGIYVGGSALRASADFDSLSENFTNHDTLSDETGFKAIAGIRPVDWLSAELNYVDFGKSEASLEGIACIALAGVQCPTRVSFDTTAISASVLGHLSLPFFDVFGRVGLARWESERSLSDFFGTSIPGLSKDYSGTDPTYGAGVQVRLGSCAIRAEYERFELEDDSIDSLSLGFTYTFL